jgi:hypothetical protein
VGHWHGSKEQYDGMTNAIWLNPGVAIVYARADVQLDAAYRCEERSSRSVPDRFEPTSVAVHYALSDGGVLPSRSCLVKIQ